MSFNHGDPFAPAPMYPSVKFPLPGAEMDMYITELGEWRQAIDFETKLPAVWKSGAQKMQLRILGDVDGVESALYVTQFSNLFKAIQKARHDAGAELAPLGRLQVRYTGDVPVEGNKILKAKEYVAKYTPLKADGFGEPPVRPGGASFDRHEKPNMAGTSEEIPF